MVDRVPLRTGPLVPRVEQVLRERISAGDWAVAQRIPNEAALATELGVGRSSVREAIRLIARDGLLDVRHGVGTFVTEPPDDDGDLGRLLRRARLLEVCEARTALEVEAARLAAERARPDELTALRDRLGRRHDSNGPRESAPDRFVAADLDFHRGVVDLAGNQVLSALFTSVLPLLHTAMVELVTGEPELPDTSCAHDDLLAALERGDPDGAEAATRANLDTIMTQLREGGAR
ncbi:FadR family transcriptional regulator [Rhodococcus spelaei]|uniref:FadR family transcriptional regulator n=1 Tax=Rhodococcus spelaei TaxID=2546320 RepID=A0A541B3T8_9NOCA|nr:FCD domain-containing protein [Rhodococcus spelaei]TQF66972.1 FadR family transcriptional regulator [Rhodococcus spelaei]